MEKVFENFTAYILKLNKLIQRIKIYEMKEYGLKSVHAMCLYYLRSTDGGMTAGELARLTLDDKGAISRALKLLLEKGYVAYNPNKYGEPIFLTQSGEKVAEELAYKAERAVSEVAADFNEKERKAFYDSLELITENLKKYYEKLTENGDKTETE